MRNVLTRLWTPDGGARIALEWVFVASILVLGAVTGLVAVRQAVLTELTDAAEVIFFSHRAGEARQSVAGSPPPRQAAGASEQRACD
jgi:hypothetical protein